MVQRQILDCLELKKIRRQKFKIWVTKKQGGKCTDIMNKKSLRVKKKLRNCPLRTISPFLSMFLNHFPNKSWFLRVCSTSLLETMWEKAEIAPNERSLLFPTFFYTVLESLLPFSTNSELSSAISFSLEESKICRLGKD